MVPSKAMILLLGIAILSCRPAGEQAPPVEPSDPAEESSLEPYAEKANEAIRALQSGLGKALTAELDRGGAEGAVFVCRDEAQAITARVSEETGITLGRTSHRLRNSVNAPRAWAKSIVEDAAGKKTSDVQVHIVDLGDKVGVLKPINTLGLCTNCHGQAEEISPEVRRALVEAYPTDQAVSFSVGDLRGWMWAEIQKRNP